MKRDLAKLVETARNRGWSVTRSPGGHLRLTHPNGALVYTASTPSDGRAIRNIGADIARAERQPQSPTTPSRPTP